MMLTLGLFVFMLQTLPYQSMSRNAEYRWPSNARVGLRPAAQFLGMDEENHAVRGAAAGDHRRPLVTADAATDGRAGLGVAAD